MSSPNPLEHSSTRRKNTNMLNGTAGSTFRLQLFRQVGSLLLVLLLILMHLAWVAGWERRIESLDVWVVGPRDLRICTTVRLKVSDVPTTG